MGKKILLALRSIVCVILIVALLAGSAGINGIIKGNYRMLDAILGGINTTIDNSGVNTEGLDLQYNKLDYDPDTFASAQDALADQIAAEGIVLLKNEGNTLPVSAQTTFSLFGINSIKATSTDSMMGGRDLKTLFSAQNISINETLWEYYAGTSGYGLGSGSISFGDDEDFSIKEVPLSELKAAGVLDSAKDTVPVFVMKRVVGEGRDMPRSMYNHADNPKDQAKSYIEPNTTELEILKYLNDNFDNVVLLINANAALELDWVAQFPNIRSILFSPAALQAVPGVLTGTINPSGRTVDTFAADALASPAAQNFGDYAYYNADGTPTKYNYVTYLEGIYVGYKYYETRYEDVVLGQGNAGDYDYAAEVVYPFGYGLSYTTFRWDNFQARWNGDQCTVTVEVTNTGDMAGKDVVEVYIQSPYTDYDRQNLVEKSSVELAGYGKTKLLKPGESETVTVTFDKELLKAYDSQNAKTYILDAGDYYITAAKNAHDAVNNVLAAKGYTVADGMTAAGDAALTSLYTVDALDADTYSIDSYSGVKVTNWLDDARGEGTYLTRQDWVGTFPKHDGEVSTDISTWGNEINCSDGKSYVYKKVVDAAFVAKLDAFESGNPVDPTTIQATPVYGQKNGLTLIDMRGLDYDDPQWDKLLDQLTKEDYYNTIGLSGYGIEYIDSVNKPFNIDADTAAGLIYGGSGMKMYTNSMTLAQTWNQELASEFGKMIGNEALIGGANGWYAPSMNIHRTPFSGRNGEYYSEDGFLSGVVGSLVVRGAASKGMYTYIKHFVFNDQENHRGDREGQFSMATWLNEQSAREIYLKPFEMVMKVEDIELNYVKNNENGAYENATKMIRASQAIMTAFNRVGVTFTGASYDLLTGIVRNEWAFDGMIITDNANTGVFMDGYQMIEAGGDIKLTYMPESARFDFDPENPAHYHYGREAMHHVLYTVANSNAMIGAMPGSRFVDGMRLSDMITTGITVVFSLLALWFAYVLFRGFKPSKRKLAKLEKKAAKKAAKLAAKNAAQG